MLACCAALGSCAAPPGEAKPTSWAAPLTAGEWHVHLPLRSAACARALGAGDGPVDTATFELTPAGELSARSARGAVAALGGCSCVAPGLFDTDTLFSLPEPAGADHVQSNVHVKYGSAALYGDALVTMVDHCLSCELREDTPQTQPAQQGCRRFTYGGENMQTFCEDLAKSAAERPISVASSADMLSPLPYLSRTNYTYANGRGTCCLTHQHAATLVSFDGSEAVFLTAQGHPLAAEACGRLTVLRRADEPAAALTA